MAGERLTARVGMGVLVLGGMALAATCQFGPMDVRPRSGTVMAAVVHDGHATTQLVVGTGSSFRGRGPEGAVMHAAPSPSMERQLRRTTRAITALYLAWCLLVSLCLVLCGRRLVRGGLRARGGERVAVALMIGGVLALLPAALGGLGVWSLATSCEMADKWVASDVVPHLAPGVQGAEEARALLANATAVRRAEVPEMVGGALLRTLPWLVVALGAIYYGLALASAAHVARKVESQGGADRPARGSPEGT